MKTRKNHLIFTILFIIITFSLNWIYGEKNIKLKELHYDMEIKNFIIPFRVLYKGKQVKGLKSSDFKLIIDGKEQNIGAFWQEKKKIRNTSKSGQIKQRLFLLIFNISDYKIDINKQISHFFDKILKKGDRLIFISNNFFIGDRTVIDPKKEKKKIHDILEFETYKIRVKLIKVRNFLSSLLEDTSTFLVPGIDPEVPRRFFINGYLSYLREFKKNYMDLNTKQYMKIVEYLKEQEVDKWVINFYQIGGFYQPSYRFESIESFLSVSVLYREMKEELDVANKLPVKDLSRFFINSGAVVNTIFMKCSNHIDITLPDGGWNLVYMPIATNSENFLAKATKYTGGSIFSSNKTKKFFREIENKEDILYTLSYSFMSEKKSAKNKIKIIPVNRKFKVFFDNQKRNSHMKRIAKESDRLESNISLDKVTINKDYITIKISNLKEGVYNNISSRKLLLSINISNKTNRQYNRKKEFTFNSSNPLIKIKTPKLKKDDYFFVIEARDLKTGKTDVKVIKVNLI